MFITREGSHGWSAKQTKQKCSSGKNCAENTLGYSEYSREIKIFDESCGTSPKAHRTTKVRRYKRRWTAVLVTQQARESPSHQGLMGACNLKTSLISPKEDFWTTSQENSEAPTRNERNKKDEREIRPVNQSIDQLAIIREANKLTMENAIRYEGSKQNDIIQPCLSPRKDAICRATLQKRSTEDQRLKSARKAVRKTEQQ